jgi:hypothetical protein
MSDTSNFLLLLILSKLYVSLQTDCSGEFVSDALDSLNDHL